MGDFTRSRAPQCRLHQCVKRLGRAQSELAALCMASLLGSAGLVHAADASSTARFVDPDRRHKLMQALPRIEQLMADRMPSLATPGLAYGVVVDGELVLVKGLGLRDVASKAPVDADTVFRIASMTKSFTALAVLMLRDAGKLALDEPVSRYVPELAQWQPLTKDAGPITLRHLLSHTGGLPEDNPSGDRLLDMPEQAFSDWLKGGVPFSTASGSEFEYANLGFMLLGRVITVASGRPYQRYISEEILKPLGMNATYWSPAAVPTARLALGYSKEGDQWVAEAMPGDGAAGAMGGLLTTPGDLARFISMMLSAYPPRDEPEQAPAPRRTLREMQAGQGFPDLVTFRPLPGSALRGRAWSYGYGLGSVMDCEWGREVTHSGGLPGFGSVMRWLPDQGVGVLVLANVTYAETGRVSREMLQVWQDGSVLARRQPVITPTLQQAVQRASELVLDWRDDRAAQLAAGNLFLDEPAAKRKTAIAKLREGLGVCKLGEIKAENALRGQFRIDCDAGWLTVQLTLAPTQPPRVQSLEVTGGRPPSASLKTSADAVVKAFSLGAQGLRLAQGLLAADVSNRLEVARLSHGNCRLGEALSGDGQTEASFALACDRGGLRMSLTLSDEGRLSKLELAEADGAHCAP